MLPVNELKMDNFLTTQNEFEFSKPLAKFIGIGGVSRSGKTFLGQILAQNISNSVLISQDLYVPVESSIPEIKGHTDWERPEAIDWQSLKSEMNRAGNTMSTVIVEGLLVFNNKIIYEYFDKTIFITLSEAEFKKRKRKDLRWGKEPEWYIDHIWQSYQKYGQLPLELKNTLIINGEEDFEIEEILSYILT